MSLLSEGVKGESKGHYEQETLVTSGATFCPSTVLQLPCPASGPTIPAQRNQQSQGTYPVSCPTMVLQSPLVLFLTRTGDLPHVVSTQRNYTTMLLAGAQGHWERARGGGEFQLSNKAKSEQRDSQLDSKTLPLRHK